MAFIIFKIHKLIVKCFDTAKVRYIVLPYNYMFSFLLVIWSHQKY
jgi:hypothetical protein